jgi:Pumilio-family RNA binding repeat
MPQKYNSTPHVCSQLGARLQRLGPEDAQFIYNACGEHCVDVATHRHGCCVMQRCLDFANPQQRAELVERICQHVLQLAQVRPCVAAVQWLSVNNELGLPHHMRGGAFQSSF